MMANMNFCDFSIDSLNSRNIGIKAEKELSQITQGTYLDMGTLVSPKEHERLKPSSILLFLPPIYNKDSHLFTTPKPF